MLSLNKTNPAQREINNTCALMSKICIAHIITGLDSGGAEAMLYKLLSRMDKEVFGLMVVSLMDHSTYGEKIESLGVKVYSLGMKRGRFSIIGFCRLVKLLRNSKPNLLQGWMYHGNLAAQLVCAFIPSHAPVLWNIRQSLYSLAYEKKGTAIVIRICRYLTRFPKRIVYNSKTSAEQHEYLGYRGDKRIIIPNGFDVNLFAPSIESGKAIRAELDVSSDALLIGLIGRYHPMKDHTNFLQAASLLLKHYSNVCFVLAGTLVDKYNKKLQQEINDLDISSKVYLLGERTDMPRLTASFDIASSSSSYGEGFPNVIGEAMSCGVPCVVTDVGDSAWIVGDTGIVVPPRDPVALANGWRKLIELGYEKRLALGMMARQRIIENFSLDDVVKKYEMLYKEVLGRN